MIGWFCLLAAALGGCGLLEGLGWARWPGPTWLRIGLRGSLGAGLGIGLSSGVFVPLLWAGLQVSWAAVIGNLTVTALGGLAWKHWGRRTAGESRALRQPEAPQPWLWALRAAGVVTLALVAAGWAAGTKASPHGDWDAFSIWNLRAKFLASGQPGWRYAVSPEIGGGQLGAAHPDYPLLLSATVASL